MSTIENITKKIIRPSQWETIRTREHYQKVVFTNGCFDLLHRGHITYLAQARDLGDCLVVGLNTDASVKRLKGDSRPINRENDRALLLAALTSVNYVVLFDEDTPLQLIRQISPDVLVKGGDYAIKDIVGASIVIEKGGSVQTLPFVNGYSSTNLIHQIK